MFHSLTFTRNPLPSRLNHYTDLLSLAIQVQPTATTEESVPDGFDEDDEDDFDWDEDDFGATSTPAIATTASSTTATTSSKGKEPWSIAKFHPYHQLSLSPFAFDLLALLICCR